jgi:hypothetical protein
MRDYNNGVPPIGKRQIEATPTIALHHDDGLDPARSRCSAAPNSPPGRLTGWPRAGPAAGHGAALEGLAFVAAARGDASAAAHLLGAAAWWRDSGTGRPPGWSASTPNGPNTALVRCSGTSRSRRLTVPARAKTQ